MLDIEDFDDLDSTKTEKIIYWIVKIICWTSVIFAVFFMMIINFSSLIGLSVN